MIKIMLEKQGAYFIITIDEKVIKYWDKLQGGLWGGPLQYLPRDPSVINKIKMSRNKIPADFINLFDIPKEELEEFTNAKDDRELRDLVIKDAKKNGCKIIDEKIE